MSKLEKILSAKQIYKADRATIENQSITSVELMERAGKSCFDWLHNKLANDSVRIHVFCGIGNNGGDGLVISRYLIRQGYNVATYVVEFSDKRSSDFLHNLGKLTELGQEPKTISDVSDFPEISKNDFVIDTIFGIGLKRKITGFSKDLITSINESKSYILSIDMPSGLYADSSKSKDDIAVEATHVLTFQCPKLAFLLPDNQKYIRSWSVLDIGLDKGYINSMSAQNYRVDEEYIKSIYKRRTRFSHKGSFGHAMIIGGSYGKIGAVSLASIAALRSGSGLVTSYIPKCGYEIIQSSIPEAMAEVDTDKELVFFNYKSKPTVIGIGPGMGASDKTLKGFTEFLEENKLPLVIDADGLNLLSKKSTLLELLPDKAILTPHPKELERLMGKWDNDYEKLEKLSEFSQKHDLVVVLKGANTVITYGGIHYFNTTGNPALATAGSGDVLTGVITGLLAQKYKPLHAAILGAYLHGKAADIGVESLSMETFIASDILTFLSKAYKSVIKEIARE